MAKKKPPEDEQFYSTEEVEDRLNNAVIGLLRWDKLKDFKAVRGKTLREFSLGIVSALTEEVLFEKDKPDKLLIPPAEIALALQAAALLILYQYEIPEDQRRKTFLKSLIS